MTASTVPRARRPAGRERLIVGLLTAAGLALRLRSFGNSLFSDELSTYYIATHHSLGQTLHILHGHSVDLNPPLYFLLAWASEKLGGDSAQMLRLASLVAGVATIPLVYLLGKRTVSRRVGVIAAALAALAPFLIHYSAEARPYSLLVFLVVAGALALLQALQTGRWTWWALYAALSCGALYTQYTSAYALAGMFVWAFVTHPEARGRLVAANLVAGLVFAIWLPAFIDNLNSPGKAAIGTFEPFGAGAAGQDLVRLALGNPYVPLDIVPGRVARWLAATAIVIAVVGLAARRGGQGPGPRMRSGSVLPVVLLLSVPICLGIYSALATTAWDARNLIAAWAGLAVVLGALAWGGRRPWNLAATGFLVISFALAAGQAERGRAQAPDYDGAAAFIARQGRAGDPVVEAAAFTPGPPTEMEAALALGPRPVRRDPVLRLNLPPLKVVLGAPPYAKLPRQSGAEVAREAVASARRGRLFFVVPGHWPAQQITTARAGRPSLVVGLMLEFLRALPRRFRLVRVQWFSGFIGVTAAEFVDRR